MPKKMTYQEMLKHPKWQKKRLEILSLHDFKCDKCGDDSKTLNIHHGYYDSSLKLWEYDNDTLHCYCTKHHKEAHKHHNRLNKLIATHDIFSLSEVLTQNFTFLIEIAISLKLQDSGDTSSVFINDDLMEMYRAFKGLG